MGIICERSEQCLNFRHTQRTPCSACGQPVTTNHYHSIPNNYRLCSACFFSALPQIEACEYEPPQLIAGEVAECLNGEVCFACTPYGMHVPKLCDDCGLYPDSHFHDIARNIRLCLICFLKRRAEYGPSGPATRGQ